MKRILITFTFLLCMMTAFAQKGKISGKVKDGQTNAPVDYATIAICKQGTTAPVNGATADAKGAFTINNIPYGEYMLYVEFLGYQRVTVEHIVINSTTPAVALNNITMATSQRMLNSVNITGQVSTVENKIDKLVYNVGNDLTSQGGVATDILKKVPMVTVDIDGNVELLGNPSVKFLINGKPSSIFGASLTDALQSIPSSQIKSIEVITSPGAKYDASGTGGIINIILKDNKVQGYNASINLAVGTRQQNTSVNVNVRSNKIGFNGYFSGNRSPSATNLGSRTRANIFNDTTQNQFQNIVGYVERSGYQTGLGFDWSPTKKDNFTGSVGYHHFTNSNIGITNQEDQQLKGSTVFSDLLSLRNSNSQSGENSVDVNLEYKHNYKKDGQELDIQYNSGYNRNMGNYYQKVDYLNSTTPSLGSSGDNPGHNRETEINVDYTYPVKEDLVIETGAKTVIENINSVSNVSSYNPAVNDFIYDPLQSNNFTYGRYVYAYYISATFKLFNFFDGKAGLRDEYTITSVDFPNTNIPDYNFLSPSFVLSHKFSKTQAIKLSYSKRIERPDFGDLNPFINYSDPYNITYGNPNLHPEIGNGFELNYNYSFGKGGNISASAFFRHNGFDVKQYTFRLDSLQETAGKYYKNVYVQTRANVGAEITGGLNISSSVPITEKLMLRSNIIMMQRRVMVNLPNVPNFVLGYEYRFTFNAAYQFNPDLAAEGFLNYNTPRTGFQGTNSSFAAYNFALRQQFLNKKLSLGLTANVPFNEYVNQTQTIIQTQPTYSYQYGIRQLPFRSFGVTLSYKFGKLEFKNDDDKNKGNNAGVPSDQ